MYWWPLDTGGPRHAGSDGDPALPWAHSSHPAVQRNKESPESSPYIGPAQTRKKEATDSFSTPTATDNCSSRPSPTLRYVLLP